MSEAERLTNILQSVIMESLEVSTTSGEKVPIGSDAHLGDLQTILTGIKHVRDQHPRTSAKRATYAQAANQLSRYIRRLQRIAQQRNATPEIV